MNKYELTVIVPSEISEEDRETVLKKIEDNITTQGGEILSRDMWGRRDLAYPIKKYKEGIYVLITFMVNPSVAQDIDYKVKINDDIIRHLLVKAEK